MPTLPAAPGAVLDDDLLAEHGRELRLDDAGGEIRGPAGRERHDDLDGLIGIVRRVLRHRADACRNGEHARHHRAEPYKPPHRFLPGGHPIACRCPQRDPPPQYHLDRTATSRGRSRSGMAGIKELDRGVWDAQSAHAGNALELAPCPHRRHAGGPIRNAWCRFQIPRRDPSTGSSSPAESRWRAAARTAFPFLVVGALWELVARLAIFPPRLFPPLEVVASAFVRLTVSGVLPHHVLDTLVAAGCRFRAWPPSSASRRHRHGPFAPRRGYAAAARQHGRADSRASPMRRCSCCGSAWATSRPCCWSASCRPFPSSSTPGPG